MTRFNNTDEASLEGTEKALMAWEARKRGATLDQAAKIAGYANRGAAHNAITSLKRSYQVEASAEMVKLEEDRLDYYLFQLDAAIRKGDVKAILAAVKIQERRSKLLGLDDFERRMAELNERKIAIEERDVRAVALAMANVLRKLELDPDQMATARALVRAELAPLAGSPDVIRGELDNAQ
jgi:hypothetical protein